MLIILLVLAALVLFAVIFVVGMQLTVELTSTENKVSFARQAYNDAVMAYNTQREVFPSNLVAGPFNFKAAELFEIEKPEERAAPKVSFA